MIQMSVIGYLGQDAVVREHNNKKVINFSVAHDDSYKDKDGTKVESAVWVQCSIWGDNTALAQYLKKGTQVFCQGYVRPRTYQNSNREWVACLDLVVYTTQLLGGSKNNSGPSLEEQFAESAKNDD